MNFLLVLSLAFDVSCMSSSGVGLGMNVLPGSRASVEWNGMSRTGQLVHDDLMKVVIVYFDDGRFVVEDSLWAPSARRAYGKLSMASGAAVNFICSK